MAILNGREVLFSPVININGEGGTNGKPIEVSTEEAVNALKVGTIFIYTGESGTFEQGAMYLVEEGE